MNLLLRVVVVLMLIETTLQECGDVLGGAVLCRIDPHVKLMDKSDLKLCSHCVMDIVTMSCDDTNCLIAPLPEEERAIQVIRRYFPQETGIHFAFSKGRKEPLIGNGLRSNNTINSLVDLLKQKGLSFVHVGGASQVLISAEDIANYFSFLQALSAKLHEQGFYLGQELPIDRGNFLNTKFNITEVAKVVDWFYLRPQDLGYSGYMQPLTPLSTHHGRSSGTTKFWVEKALQLVKPECLVIDLGPRMERHRAIQTAVQPGPGSASTIIESAKLDVSEVCNVLSFRGPGCQQYWDDESSTPWAVCGNDYYTYENARSLRLKAEYLKLMNISGIYIFTIDMVADNECENGNPLEFLRAVQGIRRG